MNDAFDVMVGQKIKSIRIAKGYSIRQLAKRIDRSHVALMKYESGTTPMTINMLKTICNALDTDCADVINSCELQ